MKHANISLFVPHAGCPHMCSFCNQKTISGKTEILTPEEVKNTLEKAALDGTSPENTEIAFFGGSFTAIERGYMISLLEETVPFIKNGRFMGIRVSTRPDAVDSEVLEVLKSYGVTSIELGAQSTDRDVLKANMRGHTADDIFKASALIKQSGFSLGLQMMTGLYCDTNEKCIKTARDFISLRPDTVRIYPTVVLEGTYLEKLFKSGLYKPQTVEEAADICAVLLKMFYDENIKVIRLGLHSGGNVEDGFVGGPYHPAFGEICESKIYLEEAKKALYSKFKESKNEINEAEIFVNDREISKMTGQKRDNLKLLKDLGFTVKIKGDPSLSKYRVIVA